MMKGGNSKHQKEEAAGIPPKGWMAIRVGKEEEEEQQRFVVPVMYLNHPLFVNLLKAAEEEYGFDHKGAITIPCQVDYFRQVQEIIDRDTAGGGGGGGGGSHHHGHHNHHRHHHHHHHHVLAGCFKA